MNDELRVSDVEREQVVARLREASAEGRLTLDELASRTGSAYVARTRGELVQVTGTPDEQASALRDAMRVLFPEAVALVSAARQGFMREQ